MSRERTKTTDNIFLRIAASLFPTKKDNLKRIITKLLFLVSLVTLIISSTYLIIYFASGQQQKVIINRSRNLKQSVVSAGSQTWQDFINQMLAENPDFKGWITIPNTLVDNPFYQATDDEYYLKHNQLRESSGTGAVYLQSDNVIRGEETDDNLVFYGHSMKNGSMFGTLARLRSLSFYQKNPTVQLSTLYSTDEKLYDTYKIYAVFVMNATSADDNGYMYDIRRRNFSAESEFNAWVAESFERSLLNTGVDVQFGDSIITLITCSEDFDNARLVVMARKTRESEEPEVDTSKAKVNPKPRYPKRWYDDRKRPFPYE